jgi:hypothetical protein
LEECVTDQVYQLAYLSTRKQDVTDEEIVDGIVLPSLTKNRALGVTGCLWFDGNHFFQVLEGSLDTIESLFAVIATDQRHESVDRLTIEDTIGVRRFKRFGMRRAASEAARSMPEFIEAYKKQADPAAVRPPRWRDRASRVSPATARDADTDRDFGTLTRTVIDQLADWSEATPA